MKDFTMNPILMGSMKVILCRNSVKHFILSVFTVFLVVIPYNDILAQKNTAENVQGVVPVITPTNGSDIYGFEIDGNAKALNFPLSPANGLGYGDWFSDPPPVPEGLGLFKSDLDFDKFDGTNPVFDAEYKEGELSFFLRDDISNNDPSVFDGSNKINDNPNTYKWKMGSAPSKNEIQTVAVHFTYGAASHPEWPGGTFTNEDDLWIIFAGDREDNNGSSYIDFELLQQTLTKNSDGTFTSGASAATGGRSVGDLLVTLEFTIGGAAAKVVVREWKAVNGGYEYVLADLTSNKRKNGIFASVNTVKTIVPWSVYDTEPISTNPSLYQYDVNQWAEGAVNLSAFFPQNDPCLQISTLFIRTRTSGSSGQSQLKDFPGDPIQLQFDLTPNAPTVADVSNCGPWDGSLIASGCEGILKWYDAAENGNLLYTGEDSEDNSFDPGEISSTSSYWVSCTVNGCEGPRSMVTVTVYDIPDLEIDATNVTCFEAGDGTVLVPENDYSLILYRSDTENGTYEEVGTPNTDSDGNFINLGPGWYYVEATESHAQGEGEDAIECEADSNKVEIMEPDEITVSIDATNVSCYDEGDGSIDVTASGEDSLELYRSDTSDGTYVLVESPSTDEDGDFISLGPGFYKVKAIAAGGNEGDDDCFAWSEVEEIEEPDEITVSIDATNVSCYDEGDGSIDVTASGEDSLELYRSDTSDGTYVLVESPSTEEDGDFISLGPGFYKVKAIAAGGNEGDDDCFAWSEVEEIEEPDDVLVSGTGFDPTCENLSGGYISVTASGYDRLELWSSPDGIVAYTQSVADVTLDVDDNITGLGAGYYVVKAFADGGNGEEDECTAETDPIVLAEPICDEEACTLGYWKNHTNRWCREGDDQDRNNPFIYETCDLYGEIFGIDFSAYGYDVYEGLTLLQALNQEGGGVNNLLRQSVAALLNICADEISYPYSGNLIEAVQDAFENGTEGELASELDMINNMYPCPMGGSSATVASTCSNGTIAPAAAILSSEAEAVENGDVILYPVPFSDVLNVQYEFGYTSDVVIEVYAGTSLLKTFTDDDVTKGSSTQLNMSFANVNQMYIIRVITSKEVITKKASK
ncbi:Ig-like domain-containing protein [Salinimicrobium sp. CAU 1759]